MSDDPSNEPAFLLAQYAALREEIQRRTDHQHQVVLAALSGAGVLLAIGVQLGSPTILLLFPPLSLSLASVWAHHAYQIERIGTHLRRHAERILPGGAAHGWQLHEARSVAQRDELPKDASDYQRPSRLMQWLMWIATASAFVITQLLALALAVSVPVRHPQVTYLNIGLAILDVVFIIITGLIVWRSSIGLRTEPLEEK